MEVVVGREAPEIVPVVIDTQVGAESQAFKGRDVQVDVAEHLIGVAFVVGQEQAAQRVDVFFLHPFRLGEAVVFVFVVQRREWVVCKSVGDNRAEGVVDADVLVLGPVDVEVIADADEIVDLPACVQAEGVAFVTGLFSPDHAFLVPVLACDVHVFQIGGQAVVLYRGRSEYLFHPAGVFRLVGGLREPERFQGAQLPAILVLFAGQQDVVFGAEHFRESPGGGSGVEAFVGDFSPVFLAAFFRGDDHHPVGGASAVDGAGSCVFQHVDRLNVARADVVDAADLEAVDDKQRRVVAVGADTANEQRLRSAGLPG